jgi:glycosyltransferase involved in cell wall biosynthesis
MRIAFLFVGGRIDRLERVARGKAMADFFHGALELRAKGHEVGLFELTGEPRYPIIRRVGDFLHSQNLLPPKTNGYFLEQTKNVIPLLRNFEVVVVSGTPLALALTIWKQLGLMKLPIVGIHCAMFNQKYNVLQRWMTKHLFSRMWTMLFGEGEYKPLKKFFRIDTDRVIVNQFSTDIKFWTPAGQEGEYILSIGNDNRRDYEFLMKVAAQISAPFKVITKIKIKNPIPSNVEIISGDMNSEIISDENLRDFYRGALCIVIPLVESVQPSGQSVCLQAMACKKAVILTRTSGLWSESIMQDDENILFVPPGDQGAMIKKIKILLDRPEKRNAIGQKALETVRREFNMDRYADQLEKICQSAILNH